MANCRLVTDSGFALLKNRFSPVRSVLHSSSCSCLQSAAIKCRYSGHRGNCSDWLTDWLTRPIASLWFPNDKWSPSDSHLSAQRASHKIQWMQSCKRMQTDVYHPYQIVSPRSWDYGPWLISINEINSPTVESQLHRVGARFFLRTCRKWTLYGWMQLLDLLPGNVASNRFVEKHFYVFQ